MAIQFVQTVDLGNYRIVNLGVPSGANDAATKTYVDTLLGTAINGLAWGRPVRVASTANVNIASPPAAIDGVTLANNDRVLLKNQTDPVENGVYLFNGTALVRAADTLQSGSVFAVQEGTAGADKVFLLTSDGTVTVGTSPLTFSPINASNGTTYTAGAAIDLTGNAIAVKYGTGLKIGGTGNLEFDSTVLPVALGKYAANIGDGASDTITVTHNLNTFDVDVTVYDNAGNKADVWTEVRRTGVNTVQIVFGAAPASGAYRVVVIG